MIYRLFTDGRELLSAFLIPLACLTVLAPVITTAIMGAGIQRTDDQEPTKPIWIKWMTILIVVIGVTAIYLYGIGEMAIQTVPRRTSNSALSSLLGAPANVDANRLLIFSLMLIFLQFVVAVGLHNGMNNGGWLHEWSTPSFLE